MAPNFLDLATTLENSGARWLLEKKVNFVPWVCFLKLIKHRIGIKKGWFLYKINQRTLRNAQRSRNAYTVEPHVTKIQNLLTLVRGEHCYQLAEYLTFKQFFVKVWV